MGRLRWSVIAGLVVLAVACGRRASRDRTPSPAFTVVAAALPTQAKPATPDNTPLPVHVNFAPGEVINTDGQAGVVFVDPTTGNAEGWLLPGVPANYSFSLAASDGHLFFYRCQHPNGWPSPAGCDPPNARYLFDTRTGDRVRLDMFTDDYPPVVIWPEGDEVLGVTASGPVLVSLERPDQPRNVDVPAGYQLFTPSALSDRDGTHVIVSAFHHGTPQCGDSPGPFPQHACGGGLLLWQTLLIDRSSGVATPLAGATRSSSFAWSPDGSMFLVARAKERPEDGSEIAVYSRDGKLVWSQPRPAVFSNASWSPDGSSIAMQILSKPEMIASAMRLDVLDAATGATRYRIVGASACEGRIWTADGTRLILLGAYGFDRSVVADPRDGTLRALRTQLSPSVTEPDIAYEGSASVGTTAVNIDSGETRQVASFSSPMASSTLAGSPLLGGRFAFVATIAGGRGGCAEAIDPASPPTTHFEYPPFTD